jgi:hypothetical protein
VNPDVRGRLTKIVGLRFSQPNLKIALDRHTLQGENIATLLRQSFLSLDDDSRTITMSRQYPAFTRQIPIAQHIVAAYAARHHMVPEAEVRHKGL